MGIGRWGARDPHFVGLGGNGELTGSHSPKGVGIRGSGEMGGRECEECVIEKIIYILIIVPPSPFLIPPPSFPILENSPL
ncbi:MAG: hypothetical protein C4323_11980 [Mastigocladus sp. ERB_26_2]